MNTYALSRSLSLASSPVAIPATFRFALLLCDPIASYMVKLHYVIGIRYPAVCAWNFLCEANHRRHFASVFLHMLRVIAHNVP